MAQITDDILATRSGAGESALGALIADAQRTSLDTDFAFLNASAIEPQFFAHPEGGWLFSATPGRSADADGRVLESEVTNAVFGVETRNNATNVEGGLELVSLQLTGQEIYDFLESRLGLVDVSGLTYTWDAAVSAPGVRITEVRVGDTLLDKAATYSVAMNDRLLKSVSAAKNVVRSGKNPVRDLIAYLESQNEPISPPAPRVTRLN